MTTTDVPDRDGSADRRLHALCHLSMPLLLLAPQALCAREPAPLPYVVRHGDTLIGIGKTLLVRAEDWREVARLNRLRNPNFIPVGSVLMIPPALLRGEMAPAAVVQSIGEARGTSGQPLRAGESLPEGAEISTGSNGYVTLRLADGTLLRVQAATRAQIEAARRYQELGTVDSAVRLQNGRVEVEVTPSKGGKPRFEVRTPQGVLGVRGTDFRVAADGQASQTRSEVLTGAVDVEGLAQTQRLPAGFGAVVDSAGRMSPPVALLAAPDVAELPKLQERVLVRFAIPAQTGAAAYRGQVARDATFQQVVGEYHAKSPELRFGDLSDGNYYLRVRAIDAAGLEGRSAQHAFRLKARPEAPLPSAPAPRTKLRAAGVDFTWARNPDAATYHFQLARDVVFSDLVRDLPGLRETTLALTDVAPGDYFWRLASVRVGDDRGPWGDPQSFVLGPLPANPQPPAVGDKTVRLAWTGEPGQTFELQVARDAGFRELVIERRLTEPNVDLPRPTPGRYFVRYRAIDADGFIGPFSGVQQFELTNCVVDSAGACVKSTFGLLISP